MASFGSIVWSSVGKKVLTGLTGFALVGFVVAHLIGNLTLFLGPDAFNGYAHFLENMAHGWGIYAFEVGLIGIFLVHMASAATVVWIDKRKARSSAYRYAKDAKGKSRKTWSSSTMIYTGIIVFAFVVLHIVLFKYGNHEMTDAGVKNLYKTVVTEFKNPLFLGFTVLAMVLAGMHLRHGIWSAFQSLGLANDRYLPLLTKLAAVAAVLLAIGFIALPVVLFLIGDPNAVTTGGH